VRSRSTPRRSGDRLDDRVEVFVEASGERVQHAGVAFGVDRRCEHGGEGVALADFELRGVEQRRGLVEPRSVLGVQCHRRAADAGSGDHDVRVGGDTGLRAGDRRDDVLERRLGGDDVVELGHRVQEPRLSTSQRPTSQLEHQFTYAPTTKKKKPSATIKAR
jgi:hypothetical protein